MSRTAALTLQKPTGCEAGPFDVYPRNSPTAPFIVVDTRREPGAPGRVVAECVDLVAAKRAAKAFAERGDL